MIVNELNLNKTFKHTWTGICININIEPNIYINELKKNINQLVASKLNINNGVDYDIIIAGLPLQEMDSPINLTSTELFSSIKSQAFYIRPKNT